MKQLVTQIKELIFNQVLTNLDYEIDVNINQIKNCPYKLSNFIYSYLDVLTIENKLSLLLIAIKHNVAISEETWHYESINSICHELLSLTLIHW